MAELSMRDFRSDSLRRRNDIIVQSLYNVPKQCKICGWRLRTEAEMAAHLDWHFQMNQREKQKAVKAISRQWYLPTKEWMDWREAAPGEKQPAAPSFFDLVNAGIESSALNLGAGGVLEGYEADEDKYCVVADDKQESCVICGEAFSTFWDSEQEQWMYRGAVYSNYPDTQMHSADVLPDIDFRGPIIHKNCLSASTSSSTDLVSLPTTSPLKAEAAAVGASEAGNGACMDVSEGPTTKNGTGRAEVRVKREEYGALPNGVRIKQEPQEDRAVGDEASRTMIAKQEHKDNEANGPVDVKSEVKMEDEKPNLKKKRRRF